MQPQIKKLALTLAMENDIEGKLVRVRRGLRLGVQQPPRNAAGMLWTPSGRTLETIIAMSAFWR